MKTLLERIADMAACVEGNVEEVLLDAAKEIKRLQAKIEAVEKQEPVATVDANDEGYWAEILPDRSVRVGQNLYALPGAQNAPIVPEGWKFVPIKPTPVMKTAGIGVEVYQDSPPSLDCLTWEEVEAIYSAMIEVAPEVKSCI